MNFIVLTVKLIMELVPNDAKKYTAYPSFNVQIQSFHLTLNKTAKVYLPKYTYY